MKNPVLTSGGGATDLESKLVGTISKNLERKREPEFHFKMINTGGLDNHKSEDGSFHIKEGQLMFYGHDMEKIFCSCGAIAELDSISIKLKQKLGKEIECRACRNRRIAEELEESTIYVEDDEGWLY